MKRTGIWTLAAGLAVSLPARAVLADPLPATSPSPAAARAPIAPPAPSSPPGPRDTVRDNLIIVTGGLAITGLGLGAVFGGLAISRWNDTQEAATSGCRDPSSYTGCTRAVGDLQIEASSFATISTFCFIAGTGAFAGTILLWVTGPRDVPPGLTRVAITPVVGPGAMGGVLQGSF